MAARNSTDEAATQALSNPIYSTGPVYDTDSIRQSALIRQESGVGIQTPNDLVSRTRPSSVRTIAPEMVKEIHESIEKLMTKQECSPKEKHTRSVIISTWKEEGCSLVWEAISKYDLASNALMCWKAMYILHRVLRDGHAKSVTKSARYLSYLGTLLKRWAIFQGGYHKLSVNYIRLIIEKIKFHIKYPAVPANMKIQLDSININSGDMMFQMEVDVLELESAMLSLEGSIFNELDPSKGYSTQVAQCRVAPLVPVIEGQAGLFELSQHLMKLLHSNLPEDLLAGHRERFSRHYVAMRKFWLSSKSLSYVSSLTQIKDLPIQWPKFVSEEKLPIEILSPTFAHGDEPNFEELMQDQNAKDDLIEQLLRENIDVKQKLEAVEESQSNYEDTLKQSNEQVIRLKSAMNEAKQIYQKTVDDKNKLEIELQTIQEKLKFETSANQEKAKMDETVEKAKKMYFELREEHIKLLKTQGKLKQHILETNQELEDVKIENQKLVTKVESCTQMIENKEEQESRFKCDLQEQTIEREGKIMALKEKLTQQEIQLTSAVSSQERELALEIEIGQKNISFAEMETKLEEKEQEFEMSRSQFRSQTETYESQLNQYSTRMHQLQDELTALRSEEPLTIEDQVDAEMLQTSTAIEQATIRIQEILEASKNHLTGVKLEVNGNILGACNELMQSIKFLIEKSKIMQREIVSVAGANESSTKDFYRKNHRWTEGLISAAKVVGSSATYLVEAADRCTTGKASYEELMVVSKDISASTVQLVVTSQVKADKDSGSLKSLKTASQNVSNCVGKVIASAQVGAQQLEESDMIDFTNLSYVRARKLERDFSINVLEMEMKLEKARQKLLNLRKLTYHTSEGSIPTTATVAKSNS